MKNIIMLAVLVMTSFGVVACGDNEKTTEISVGDHKMSITTSK